MNISKINQWLWPEEDPAGLDNWRRGLRHICRFLYIFFTEYKRDRINLRAAALTYSVVLSMVPMLALSTAVLKGMGAGDQMRQAAYQLIDNLAGESRSDAAPAPDKPDIPSQKLSPSATPTGSGPALPDEPERDFSGHLYDAVDKVFDYVDRTNFAALGMVGTFLLLIAVLIVISGIEEAMNAIWRVQQSRSIGRKIMNYMALMIICPLTINLGIGASTMLNTPAIVRYLNNFIPIIWLQGVLFKLIPLFLLALTFVLLYLFLPNIKVKAKAAWIGGLSGAVGLMVLQKLFILLQIGVAKYNAIYGSFATVPLFLLWLNSAWLVFLLGAEVAFTTQHYTNYHADGDRLSPGATFALALDLVNEIYISFDQRREITLEGLAEATRESSIITAGILEQLTRANLIRRSETQPETYLPATPAAKLEAEEICSLLWNPPPAQISTPGRDLAAAFFAAGRRALTAKPWNRS
ncbi:MAG: YihY/virulence factor BrkB family protein [Deltaproteobacteria bacterium]|nr:YihY/virulence factor BrkB family protein [Deltaproteobacteria bacterium]